MRKREKVGDNPISRNLARILGSGPEFVINLERIEKETGLGQTTVRNWISGSRQPQLANLQKIANLFNIDVYSFFDEPNEIAKEQKEVIELIYNIKNKALLDAIKTMIKAMHEGQGSLSKE
jgi:transcriptional regulator with XRE-family HTH domain